MEEDADMRRNFLALALSLILALTLCGVAQASEAGPTPVGTWEALEAASGGGYTHS